METIDFLKEVRVHKYSLNYLNALPGTQISDYVKANNLIKDVEEYLSKVAKWGGAPILNLTKASNKEWENWRHFIKYRMDLHYAKEWNGMKDFLGS